MRKNIIKWLGLVVGIPILIVLFVFLSPVILLVLAKEFLLSFWIHALLKIKWPANKWILVSYTESEHWSQYLETEIIPRLGDACVVINRSRPDWKQKYPIEAKAIKVWGKNRQYNPMIVLVPKVGRVKIFRLFEEFKAKKHGKSGPLEAKISEILELASD
ncbi:MAG TPA: hypothetical protein VF651_10085 [Gammaproteobacteria bacterium]